MLKELCLEKQRNVYLTMFKKNKTGFMVIRILLGILLAGFLVVMMTLFGNPSIGVGIPFLFLIGYKMPYLDLLLKQHKSRSMIDQQFPQFLYNFIGLLHSSGNVYQTLVACLDYTDEPIRSELAKLIKKMEQNNDRQAYVTFAEYIGSTEANMIMDMIYQFSEFGKKREALIELENYIWNLHENKVDELIDKKMEEMHKFAVPSILLSILLVLCFAGTIFLHYMNDVTSTLELFN